MNFVREIVEANSLVTVAKLTNELPKILDESITLRESTHNYVEEVYVKFTNRPRTVYYFQETNNLKDKLNTIQTNYQDVVKIKVQLTKNQIIESKNKINHIDDNLKICYELNSYYEQLQVANQELDNGEYMKLAERLKTFKTIKATSSQYQHLIDVIKKEALMIEGKCIAVLETIFNNHFKYSALENDDLYVYTMNIMPRNDNIEQAMLALIHLGLYEFMQNLTGFIWKVFNCIVKHSSKIQINSQECVVNVQLKHKDNYSSVFNRLTEFVTYLSSYLDCLLEQDESTKRTIIDYIRDEIQLELINIILTECLDGTIPETEEGLESYDEVAQRTETLQLMLIQSKILDKENEMLVDYASKVKEHFVNKKCQDYRKIAITLMKKDLHTITTIGTPYNPNDLSFDGFSQCAISKSTIELLSLIEKMILKEISNLGGSSGYYLVTARDILSEYHSVVKEHHERLLKTIPQQLAIFYNNCKYIAHALTTVWDKYKSQLPSVLMEFEGFTSLTLRLNDYALEMLQEMINDQVDNIKSRIDTCGIRTACDKLEPTAEKAVRQCLRQQELLKTVWQKVLNYYDYNSTVGVLLDALSKNLIANVMMIEDIPADVCDQLVDIFKLIVTRGPKLFTEPKEIHMYVTHWSKLNETMFVLNSRMEQIGERWADGKGPLALHFTADEMRTLIRALFQNTDARAALLSVIA